MLIVHYYQSVQLRITHFVVLQSNCKKIYGIRRTFLDISNAFDKVCHKGLIFKLKSYGVDGRQQRVVLNGQVSSWSNILIGVLQGSVLGPLLFLIYINDSPNGTESICKIFANDT